MILTAVNTRLSSIAVVACAALAGCGRTEASGESGDSAVHGEGGSRHADGSSVKPSDAGRDGDATRANPDASHARDAGQHDTGAARHDASTNPDANIAGDASADVGAVSQCAVVCTTNAECSAGCPSQNCCYFGECTTFALADGGVCPGSGEGGTSGCLVTGCPAGQMCVAIVGGDNPFPQIPACSAAPAACAHDPTCPCLLEAGVCGGVSDVGEGECLPDAASAPIVECVNAF